MSCFHCGSILLSHTKSGRFEPFYCNDKYFCHWIQWKQLGKTHVGFMFLTGYEVLYFMTNILSQCLKVVNPVDEVLFSKIPLRRLFCSILHNFLLTFCCQFWQGFIHWWSMRKYLINKEYNWLKNVSSYILEEIIAVPIGCK